MRSGTFLIVDRFIRLAWVQYMHLVVKYSVLRMGFPALIHGHYTCTTSRKMEDKREFVSGNRIGTEKARQGGRQRLGWHAWVMQTRRTSIVTSSGCRHILRTREALNSCNVANFPPSEIVGTRARCRRFYDTARRPARRTPEPTSPSCSRSCCSCR